jgi:hypothetical protein
MSGTHNGVLRPRKPQLTDSISKLDEMVEGLSTAIPDAVADSIREALGASFTTAIKDAVKDAVQDAMKEAVKDAVVEAFKARNSEVPQPAPTPVPPPVATVSTPRPRRDRWARLKAALAELKTWATKVAAPVVTRAALGWAIVRVIGISTIHSRTALFSTMATGLLTATAGYALGPIGAAVLLGVVSSTIAATTIWAAPAVRFMVTMQDQ